MTNNSEPNIPNEFYNFDSGQPFSTCLVCNESLLDPPKQYMVEKTIRRYPEMDHEDIIYEYAICLECIMKQQEFISEESKQSIAQYMSNVKVTGEVDELPRQCVIHGTSKEEMREYMIQGLFFGDTQNTQMPYILLGEKAINEIQEVLSQKTRDGMDGFMDKYYGGPPEFREMLRERKTVII